MAKRGRKKKSSVLLGLHPEVYAIFLIIMAIVGIGKLGPVGRGVAALSVFFTGSLYMVFLVIVLIVGIITFLKGEMPEFLSTKYIGLYIFFIGLLMLLHWSFIDFNGGVAILFKDTVNRLTEGSKLIFSIGSLEDITSVGGGIIGGVFAITSLKLFSAMGMKIISIVFIVVGVILFTGFSCPSPYPNIV